MSIPGKIRTVLRLAAAGDWGIIRRQFNLHVRTRRIQRAGSTPFIHRTAGFPLVCHPDMIDSRTQFQTGGDDHWELALLRRWLEPGDLFVDAGANLGFYAHAAAQHLNGSGRVVAFDASPFLVARLQQDAGRLGETNLTARQCAVGVEDGEVAFHIARPGATTVSQSMKISAAESADYELHRVPMRSLASLAAAEFPGALPALVKIDIEGAEPLALRGAPPAWRQAGGPLWLIEINAEPLSRLGFKPRDILDSFPPDAFELWLLPKYPHDGNPRPAVRRYDPAREQLADAYFHNLVAVPTAPALAPRRARVARLLASPDGLR